MIDSRDELVKKNVSQFDEDVRRKGSYTYTSEQLSAQLANSRISECIYESFDYAGKAILDLGCGDGTYTLEFPELGITEILGIDPAKVAIEAANKRAIERGLTSTVKFEVGNIYDLGEYLENQRFDCIVLRGVLHHLPDAARAISCLTAFSGTIVVLEPNGNNPVLKVLEKYSRYHIEHEERSFSPSKIESWLTGAGFQIHSSRVFNLVPMFCPDWMAKILQPMGYWIEQIPILRNIACGQSIIVARK